MWQDLRFGFRGFMRQPSFTVLAILTLALGIGANTAIFGLVNSVILNPWPFENSDRLAWLWRQRAGNMMIPPSITQLESWKTAQQLEAVVSLSWNEAAWESDDGAVSIGVGSAAPQLFGFLGVAPVVGRAFVIGDSVAGAPHVVMLSERFWKTRFGGRLDAVGETLVVDGERYDIVGVAPTTLERLFSRAELDAWIPLRDIDDQVGLNTLARLNSSASFESALAELASIDAGLEKETRDADWIPHLTRPNEIASHQLRTGLWVLLGAVGLVLLISCANVANMVLARGIGRRHEMAIRTALGAGRGRLARQLITESLLLASVGTGLGIVLAFVALEAMSRWLPSGLAVLKHAGVSPGVLAVGSVVGVVSGILFGLVPVGPGSSGRLGQDLRQGARGGGGVSQSRLRQILIVGEVALAFVLFISAGLLMRSFIRLNAVDPGFDVDRLVTVRVDLPASRYPNALARHAFYEDVLGRVRQLPIVSQATVAMGVPPRMGAFLGAVELEDREGKFDAAAGVISSNWVQPEYFSTLGIQIVSGRTFETTDDPSRAAVVNQQFAREMWPGAPAVGKRFRWEGQTDWMTVLGVVGDVKAFGLDDADDRAQMYQLFDRENFFTSGVVLVRTTGDPNTTISLVRGQVQTVDPAMPIRDAMTVAAMYSASIARQRFNTLSLTCFALLALTLAVTGVYGVITLTVNHRLREIGVRLALGAGAADVKLWTLKWGLQPVVVGMMLGLVAAFFVSRLLTSLLYEVVATDVVTYGVAIVSMTAVGMVAAYVPARRAAKVDPLQMLRGE